MATVYVVLAPHGYSTKKYSVEAIRLSPSRDKAERYKTLMQAQFIAEELERWYIKSLGYTHELKIEIVPIEI